MKPWTSQIQDNFIRDKNPKITLLYQPNDLLLRVPIRDPICHEDVHFDLIWFVYLVHPC